MTTDTSQRLDELRTLLSPLCAGGSLAALLKDLRRLAAQWTRSDRAEIALEDALLRRYARGAEGVNNLQGNDAAARWVAERREPLVITDLRYVGTELDLVLPENEFASYLGVPVLLEGRARGVLYIRNLASRSYDSGEQSLLETLAALLALALSQAELTGRVDDHHRTMVRFALADPLTNLASQRHFDYMLGREWRRAQSEVFPLALLRLEIDAFTPHGGRVGPQVGRQTLLAVARVLDGALYRPNDLAARLERDRFAVLLPDTDRLGAEAIARRLVAEVAKLALPHPEVEHRTVTLSVGVAAHEPLDAASPLAAPEDLVRRADEALEQAQTVGGNQAVSA